jgi:drug/metabolite transporter (DMT)-like permease
MLTRGDALLLLPFLVVPAAVLTRRRGPWRRVVVAGAAVVGAVVVVGPWVVRNNERVGQPTLATLDSGTALAGTNCRATYYGPKLGSWDPGCADITRLSHLDEVALNNRLSRDGLRYARSHAQRLPLVVPVRVLRLWGVWDPPGEVRLESIESRNVAWQWITWGGLVPTAVLAAYGIALLRHDRARVVPLVSVLVSVTLAAAASYGKQRFRAAAEPVLLVAASVAIVHLVGCSFNGLVALEASEQRPLPHGQDL